MGKAPEPERGSPTAPPRFKGGKSSQKTEELKKSVLKALEPTEQERVAERIAEKIELFEKEIKLVTDSISPRLRTNLLRKLEKLQFAWTTVPEGVNYRFYFIIENFSLEKQDSKTKTYFHVAEEYPLKVSFEEEERHWMRLVVFIEDSLDKIIKKFKELHQKHLESLDGEARFLLEKLLPALSSLEEVKQENRALRAMIKGTIEFLKSTKGICKSKEIKIFREALEKRLREVEGNFNTKVPPLPRPDDRLIEYVEKEGGPPPGPPEMIIKGL